MHRTFKSGAEPATSRQKVFFQLLSFFSIYFSVLENPSFSAVFHGFPPWLCVRCGFVRSSRWSSLWVLQLLQLARRSLGFSLCHLSTIRKWRMWDVATSCSNFKRISAVKLQGFWALRLVPCRFCTPCPHKRQDSQLHSVVIAVTMAYLISDALWILLQPDMVMPSSFWLRLDSRAGYSERVKREANRIPTCFHVQHFMVWRLPSFFECQFLRSKHQRASSLTTSLGPYLLCLWGDSRPELPFPAFPVTWDRTCSGDSCRDNGYAWICASPLGPHIGLTFYRRVRVGNV